MTKSNNRKSFLLCGKKNLVKHQNIMKMIAVKHHGSCLLSIRTNLFERLHTHDVPSSYVPDFIFLLVFAYFFNGTKYYLQRSRLND